MKTYKLTPEQKAKKALYMKKYVLENFSKLAAYQRERQIKDKDRISKRRKAYCENNKEKVVLQKHQSYVRNRDKCLKKVKEYSVNNMEKIKDYRKKYRQSPKGRLKAYKKSAKDRGYEFALSPDEFTSILLSNCHFCNIEKANGVDRIDPKKGYIKGNVLPCCKVCNFMKGIHPYEFFIKHIKKISENTK